MASKSTPSNPQTSTLILTIPQMIESLDELHRNLSDAVIAAAALPKPPINPLADATDADGGDQIKEAHDHQAEITASTEEATRLKNLLVNMEHLKEALEKTSELDQKLNKPIQSIKSSLEEVIRRIGSSPMPKHVHNNLEFLDAINKDMKTLKFQIPSYKKLSLAGTTAHSDDSGRATAEQINFRLPNLFGHDVFDKSPAFEEIKKIYNGLDDDDCKDCKKCFLYFAVLPENVVFKKRFLTYWWIGEGILDPSAMDVKERPEVLTGKILEKLAEKGLIVPVKEDQKMVKKKFRMPPIVRSAAIKLAIESGFLDYDIGNNPIAKFSDSRCDRIFLVKGGGFPLPKAPTDLRNLKARKDVEAQMDQKLQEGMKSIFNVSQPFPDSALEWLAKKGDVDMRTVKAAEWLLKLKNLEVLYLGRWQSEVDEHQIEVESYEFLKGLKEMKKLKLLSLQGISWINKLPNSLKTLSELRVLDLKSCFNLEKLPRDIGFLKKLTHLDVSGCYMLNEMPKSISKLTELTVLKGFISGRSNLKDLIGLKKLRKLSINISRLKFPDETDLNVLQELGKHNLQSLTIMWGSQGVKQEEVKKQEAVNKLEEVKQQEEVKKQPSSGEEVKQPLSREGVGEPSSGEGGKQSSSAKRNLMRQMTKTLLSKQTEKPEVLYLPKGLEKLELQCLPEEELPVWLSPSNLERLKKLYIRGGKLAKLGNAQWKAEVVRLKYMVNLKIEWRVLQKSFPNLSYLQKVQCPGVTFCPCDANGVWMKP